MDSQIDGLSHTRKMQAVGLGVGLTAEPQASPLQGLAKSRIGAQASTKIVSARGLQHRNIFGKKVNPEQIDSNVPFEVCLYLSA